MRRGSSTGASAPLSRRARALLVLALAGVALAVLFAPGPLGAPLRRLVNYDAGRGHLNTPDPVWNAPVDGAAFRAARRLIPDGATYYLWAPTTSKQLREHDLPGAGLLFLSRALPVRRAAEARYVLSYQAPSLLPPGLRPASTRRLGDGIYLVEVAR